MLTRIFLAISSVLNKNRSLYGLEITHMEVAQGITALFFSFRCNIFLSR